MVYGSGFGVKDLGITMESSGFSGRRYLPKGKGSGFREGSIFQMLFGFGMLGFAVLGAYRWDSGYLPLGYGGGTSMHRRKVMVAK